MHAIVIDRVTGDPAERAQAAATVLRVTAYDVRASMQAPEGGPAVLTTLGDPQRAEATRAALQQAGFEARVIDVEATRTWFDVRAFSFDPDGLHVENRRGDAHVVPYAHVQAIVRATPVSTQSKTKKVRQTKFSPVRSMLSGGLVNTTTVEETKTVRTTDSDELAFVFAPASTTLRMVQDGMQYRGLGEMMAPSQNANFAATIEALRERCTTAAYDERLRRRIVQGQVLGRTLAPAQYVDFAAWLIADSITRRRSPLR